MASLPEGLIRPDNIPAIGSAPFTPGCQISSMASETGSRRFNSNGRPLTNISTTGLPTFFSSFASSSCICGSAMEEREAFSPLQVIISPKQRTTTSDQRAAPNASANPSRLSPFVLQPNA